MRKSKKIIHIFPFIVLAAVITILLSNQVGADQLSTLELRNQNNSYKQGELIVKFKSSTPAWAKDGLIQTLGHEELSTIDSNGQLLLLKLKDGQSVDAAIVDYQEQLDIEYVQPNYIYQWLAVPNDTHYGELWGLNNVGQTLADAPYQINNPGISGMDMDAESAWEYVVDCSSIVIAVLDSGINYTHSDLAANMWDGTPVYPNHGWDFAEDDNDPMPNDGHMHGTHIAGSIGAVGNNNIGTTGLCWNAELMAIRIGDVLGPTSANIFQGISFAITHGAKVINLSIGMGQFDSAISDVLNVARDSGVVVVAAAGNAGSDNDVSPVYPCSYTHDNIVCVAALDQAYDVASFTNYGATSVDVASPGTNIMSTVPGSSVIENFSSGWSLSGGWAYDLCDFGSGPMDMLVNPSDWCSAGTYANNADDRAYKQFNLSGLLGAGVSYYPFIDTEPGFDFFRVASDSTGADPFISGNVLEEESGSTLPFAFLLQHSLSNCLSDSCAIGFQLTSDATVTWRGIGILGFQINTAELNSERYDIVCGTSCSAPHVSALAAMIWVFNPKYNYGDVVSSIVEGGDSVAVLQDITTSGKASNAMGSLQYINPPTGVLASVQGVTQTTITWLTPTTITYQYSSGILVGLTVWNTISVSGVPGDVDLSAMIERVSDSQLIDEDTETFFVESDREYKYGVSVNVSEFTCSSFQPQYELVFHSIAASSDKRFPLYPTANPDGSFQCIEALSISGVTLEETTTEDLLI